MPEGHEPLDDDELHLARLGYSQELQRSWSGFSNFAISFSIISILAGCFTSFGLGWNNGGPAAIAWGWPIVSAFILVIGLCLSELVSAFPTSGGIYWWAAKLGGPKAGYYTGWLNLIGLVAILASVAYGSATFLDLTLGTISEGWLAGYSLRRVFVMFLVILVCVAVINIFSSQLLAVINTISVWWHVAGAVTVIGILIRILHYRLSDQRIANAVRVQPGPCGARPPAVVQDQLAPRSGQRGDHHGGFRSAADEGRPGRDRRHLGYRDVSDITGRDALGPRL